jgi:CubicO group peptidase (beta-lactamase class C family)
MVRKLFKTRFLRIIYLAIPGVCLFFCQLSQLSAQAADPIPAIGELIQSEYHVDSKLTPGFILGIVLPDTSIVYSFGNHGAGDTSQISPNEIFDISGLTKVFTAELVYYLETEKSLNLDLPLKEMLPEHFHNSHYSDLTLQALLNHASGLPRKPYGMGKFEDNKDQPYASLSKDSLLKLYNDLQPALNKKGNRRSFSYSHLNYALIEISLEKHYEKLFPFMMSQLIFLPMGMNSSSISTLNEPNQMISPGYDKAAQPGDAMIFSSYGASLGMRSTLNDLMAFSRYKLDRLEYDKKWKKQAKFVGGGIRRHLDVDHGWYVLWKRKKPVIYSHSGHGNIHTAYMHLVPETGIGLILLANSATGTEDLSLKILNLLHDYKL